MIELVLVILDLNKKMRIEANTLDFAISRVLLIKYKNEKQKLVAYISKLLNETERNYKIHNKEILTIISCLEVWKYFLKGAKSQFKILTNHKNLEYFIKA